MSIHKAWYVNCDGCYDPTEISTDSAVDARRLARMQGFVRRRDPETGEMQDLCEDCAGTSTPERRGQKQAINDLQRQNQSGRS